MIRQVLIPYLEYAALNIGSEEGANVNCLQQDSQMKLRANRPIKKGDIIIQGEQPLSNTEILMNSGHLFKHNTKDCTLVTVAIKE